MKRPGSVLEHRTEPNHNNLVWEVVMADLEPTALATTVQSTNNTKTRLRAVCALYMRVSTKGHGQTSDTQALALKEYAERRGFDVQEYRDEGVSGTKDRRPALDKLMADARARKFDVVIVARFDRFARSVSHLLRALEEFKALGIDFVSLNESIDTSTPMGEMIFTVLAAVAELERSIITERVHAGVNRARKEGRHSADRRSLWTGRRSGCFTRQATACAGSPWRWA
jgi:predicted site-specific integrase-resolvase